jgi:2-(1,2-epoxy-1,2-dihydrophenyl)acetyl-CoA isomerase
MSDFETINYEVTNRVATITLNLPGTMNAISQKMRHELLAAVQQVETDEGVRIAVIAAEGRGFSSGTDLSEGLAGFETIEDQIQEEYKPILMGIDQSSKLFISSVHGACAGIGSALAMGCDLTVMSEDAFIYLPFAGISLVPDGGASFHVVKAMGYKRALQLFVEAGRLKANDCLEYGLANKVVPSDQLREVTQQWAEVLAEGAPLAHRWGKKCLKASQQRAMEEVLDMEARHQVECSTSADSLNAVAAFFKKEKPVFTGK